MEAKVAALVDEDCAQQAQAASGVYAVLAEVLMGSPTQAMLDDVARVAEAFGVEGFEGVCADAVLAQRFDDRFVVPSTRVYVPLSESCIRGMDETDGVVTYGRVSDANSIHAARCYAAAGFDIDAGRRASAASLCQRDDALAIELAFMAHLASAEAATCDEAAANHARMWQREFLQGHLLAWVDCAAACLVRTEDDFYARVAALAAAWCRLDVQRVS